MQASKYSFQNIQMLRAIAALFVVLHHVTPHYLAMGGDKNGLINITSEWGFLGVDIFFVISGFIMAYTTFSKARTISNAFIFIKHRLFRIYLGYWVFFLIMLFVLYYTNPQDIGKYDILGSFFLINADMFELVLPISWSLSYELYFYLLFLSTFLFSVRQLYIFIPLLFGTLFVIVFLTEPPRGFFYSAYLLEFFSGVLLYMYKDYLMKSWIIVLSLVIVLVAYGYGISYECKNGLSRVLTFGVGAFFVLLLALILEHKKLYISGSMFKSLGDASYTLYLSHLVIISLFYHTGLRDVFTTDGWFIPFIGLVVVLLFCIFFSLIYYQKIEKVLYQKAIKIWE